MKLLRQLWQKVGCGADQGRTDTGAQCPRVRLVLGDVIDIGERQTLVSFGRSAEACCIPFERVSYDDVPIVGSASRNG
jgi:hypothetical protein